jgi:hypothetical protein
MNNQEPMKQRFKRGRWWKWFGEIVFDDDSPDLGWGRMLPHWRCYKPHSQAHGRKPKWRANRRLLRSIRGKEKNELRDFYNDQS